MLLNQLCARSFRRRRRRKTSPLLMEDTGLRRGIDSLTCKRASTDTSCKTMAVYPNAPRERKIFLREVKTQRYLSVAQRQRNVKVFMTELPVSLFVTHTREEQFKGICTLGFQHEGLPACGAFLRANQRFLEIFTSSDSLEVVCDGSHSCSDEFVWHPDATIQHASSGRWLSVDGDNVVLHMSNKSCWEAIPTI